MTEHEQQRLSAATVALNLAAAGFGIIAEHITANNEIKQFAIDNFRSARRAARFAVGTIIPARLLVGESTPPADNIWTGTMTEAEETKRGEQIIEMLSLHLKANGRVDTTWGDKTPLGLFRVLKRIIDGHERKVAERLSAED